MDIQTYWPQVLTIVLTNVSVLLTCFGMFLWVARQARNDYLHCQRSIESFKDTMAKETKDFHTRLSVQDEQFKLYLKYKEGVK